MRPARRFLLVPVLALAAPLLVAAPASAATVNDFTVSGAVGYVAVNAGASLEVAWEVTPADPAGGVVVTPAGTALDVVDGWDTATVAAADPTVEVTIPADAEVGQEYTFQIVVSEASGNGAPSLSEVVTVEVTERLTVVTPAPVVVEDCEFVVPEVEGVVYEAIAAGWDEDGGFDVITNLDPGRYTSTHFSAGEDFVVVAFEADGYVLSDDSVTDYPVPVDDSCFEEPELIEVDSICQGLTITNITDLSIDVVYGVTGYDEPEGDFTLAPTASRTITTDEDDVLVVAGTELDLDEATGDDFVNVQFLNVEVDQDCAATAPAGTGKRPIHPTVAPAAGR